MNKSGYLLVGAALIAVGAGSYQLGRSHPGAASAPETPTASRRILYYRNPMNPQITSPTPTKDEMGMDYVPVYADASSDQRKVLFYRNPMNPSVTSPVPAKDEMGMDYVPVYADGGSRAAAPGTVSIDPTIVQDIGVRTVIAERRSLVRKVRTVGRATYDEQGLSRLHLRTEGWVEQVIVAETGQPVVKGQALLSLYSPQIVTAEQEYRLALAGVAALDAQAPVSIAEQARALRDSSAERLRLLGVPPMEIRRLADGGDVRRQVTMTAPASGVVQFVGAREGQFVSAQTEVYRIADLSTVWVIADLYEDEVPWVRAGQAAKLQFRGLPGRTFEAKVDYVYPYLEGKTRTQKLRLVLANPDCVLKPEMFADVSLEAGHPVDAVAVPEAAVVRSGTRAQVFVVREAGRFEPREVKVGVSADGQVQILDGLAAGERVVVSSQFLIDSESKLREAAAKMLPPSDASAPADGMQMPMEDGDAPDQTMEAVMPPQSAATSHIH